jgi:nucleoside-diphosphate-sugar epimerase
MGFNHVIPELFLKISKQVKGDLPLKGDGSQKRSFCEIKDFIQAIDLLLNYETKCEIVNIGTTEEVTIYDLANMISKMLSLQVNFTGGDKPKGETSRRVPDLTKLKSLGFQPKVGLSVGLQNYLSWFSSDKTH